MKKNFFKTVLSALVVVIFLILAVGSGDGGSDASSTEYEYCPTHERSYHPDNAYKGCPDCVKEDEQNSMKNALEKARRL